MHIREKIKKMSTKSLNLKAFCLFLLSLPIWGRGLKFKRYFNELNIKESLPIWGRGLKLILDTGNTKTAFVAPYMGAWIEMFL